MINKVIMENLICSSCAGKIEKELKNIDGILNATFNFTNQTMLIETNETFQVDNEIDNIKTIVDSIEDGVNTYLPNKKQENQKRSINTLVIGLVLYLLSVYILPLEGFIELSLIVFSYLLVTRKILLKTIKGLKRKDYFNENTLMFVATVAAMLLGEFTEALLVILFYSFGEFLQNYAVKRSKSEIKGLMDLKIEHANVKYNDSILLKDPNEVTIGDIIIVKHGEKIPVDGVIVKGTTDLNTSALTGESQLQTVSINDSVLSGNINVGSVIEIKATTTYSDSTVSKIIDLIENSTNQKATPEKFITKFSKYYTPFVFFFALLMFIIPSIVNPDTLYNNAYRSATFLVISCPCALVLSIPLSYFSGIGASAKQGILFKGSSFLDMIVNIDSIALDKTGTITEGSFSIKEFTNEETLQVAASMEILSNHPISQSIVTNNKKELLNVTDLQEIPGQGLVGLIDNTKVYVGNATLLNNNKIPVPVIDSIGTIVHVAIDNKYLGNIIIEDSIKESSKEFISDHRDITFTMLTGDNAQTAKYVSQELGGISYYSNLLPEDKITHFHSIQSDKYKMFIGDGINDAPLLQQADIGVAMGKGSELAIDVADVIIMENDLSKLTQAFTIAEKTRRIVIQNITLTLGLKLLILFLGTVGLSSMLAAVFADVGVSLIAVLNSLRIIFGKKTSSNQMYRNQLFKVFGDSTVLSLLDVLYQKESTLNELAIALSKSKGFIKRRLQKLISLNIVSKTKTSDSIIYEITDEYIRNIIFESKKLVLSKNT